MRYEDILQNLDQILEFCDELDLGNKAKNSRFATYRKQIMGLIELLRVQPIPSELAEQENEYRIALTESMEFGALLPYLQQCDRACVSPKIEECLDGPILPNDESMISNRARNIQFELYLASTLWRAGLQPILGEHPDLKCQVDGKWFFFECKRVFSANNIKNRIHEARRQLRKHRSLAPQGAREIVAISLSKAFNPAHRAIHSLGQDYARKRLGEYLHSLDKSMEEEFAKLSFQKITAILYHAASSFENFSPPRFEFCDQFLYRLLALPAQPGALASLKLANAMKALALQ